MLASNQLILQTESLSVPKEWERVSPHTGGKNNIVSLLKWNSFAANAKNTKVARGQQCHFVAAHQTSTFGLILC